VPEELIASFRQAQLVLGTRAPTADQATLASFISGGFFVRHIRRMRRLYQELRSVLQDTIKQRLGSSVTLTGADVGLHAIGRLAAHLDDSEVSRRAATLGVDAPPLSNYYLGRPAVTGLVLGYGHLDPPRIRAGVECLAAAIHNRNVHSVAVSDLRSRR
jgi:GntR family transcriptional regulator/MocR family aminotransferase